MSADKQWPQWLSAIVAVQEQRPRFEPEEHQGTPPRPGEIRLAQAPAGGSKRLVCVLEVREDLDFVRVCLVSNEVEMLTDSDVSLRRETTGLPFDLVVEPDLSATVYVEQVGALFAHLDTALVEVLLEASNRDYTHVSQALRGTPVRGPSDPRWEFKERELNDLQALAGECTAALLAGRPRGSNIIEFPDLRSAVVGGDPEAIESLFAICNTAVWARSVPETVVDELRGMVGNDWDMQNALEQILQVPEAA